MILELTTAWSGPYTLAVPETLQSLNGTVVLFVGAGPPVDAAGSVLDGRMGLSAGQVVWLRASDASVTARCARTPT